MIVCLAVVVKNNNQVKKIHSKDLISQPIDIKLLLKIHR